MTTHFACWEIKDVNGGLSFEKGCKIYFCHHVSCNVKLLCYFSVTYLLGHKKHFMKSTSTRLPRLPRVEGCSFPSFSTSSVSFSSSSGCNRSLNLRNQRELLFYFMILSRHGHDKCCEKFKYLDAEL